MLNDKGKDSIYVVWKEPIERRQFVVGEICRNGKYEFRYGHEVDNAIKKGFNLFISFKNKERIYYNESLFPTFSSRLPNEKRDDIKDILKKYDLEEYNEYELLKRSGAKLPIDNLVFIDPLPNKYEGDEERYFYIAGVRHYIGCEEGKYCEKSLDVEKDELLEIARDKNNEMDSYALQVFNNKKQLLGYIPRYYSKELGNLISEGVKYTLKVHFVNKKHTCNECIKVKLSLYK
ncbi:MAG: HIRAN domain-containing protein [Terrisporobacter othiniensis]|nr:HIRAN domain-containing protein [Terrisporobacter othiniensis]MDU6996740.1 HIRAN domain-containing protein [Terrisporobacter othiniensis]